MSAWMILQHCLRMKERKKEKIPNSSILDVIIGTSSNAPSITLLMTAIANHKNGGTPLTGPVWHAFGTALQANEISESDGLMQLWKYSMYV